MNKYSMSTLLDSVFDYVISVGSIDLFFSKDGDVNIHKHSTIEQYYIGGWRL